MAEILRMPEVAANTTEAILESWNVPVNTPYAAGDALVTVETEKAAVDVEAESEGVLLRILVDAGTTVKVGTPIAVWGTSDEPAAQVDALVASLGGEQTTTEVVRDGRERTFASPLARRLARELDIDLTAVVGTGPNGRIRRRDIEAAAASASTGNVVPAIVRAKAKEAEPPASGAGFVDVPNTRMRNAIARRLTESKRNTPHFYLRAGARVDALLQLRQQINTGQDVKVSINDLLVKAIASAHARVPEMNVQWNDTSIRHFSGVDIAVAVATDAGLVTPVVRAVDSLSMTGVATATKDMINRAKERRLRQDELEGGTITITNLGMYDTEDFAAIINPPQAAILAVGAARQEAVVEEGAVTVATVLRLTLAVDHRGVDGAIAAQWLKVFVDVLENPLRILL